VAPPVLEFDAAGTFVQGWGGPDDRYDWPDIEHGIYVDHQDRVWIGGINPIAGAPGSQREDDMLLQFTRTGKFVRQIGGRDTSGGNNDTKNLKRPADVFVYPRTHEAFVADGTATAACSSSTRTPARSNGCGARLAVHRWMRRLSRQGPAAVSAAPD